MTALRVPGEVTRVQSARTEQLALLVDGAFVGAALLSAEEATEVLPGVLLVAALAA